MSAKGAGLAAALAMCAGLARGQCVQQWDGDFGVPAGILGSVYSLTLWDPDGTGSISSRLVAAGTLGSAGGVLANKIAMWDGVTWSPLGDGVGTNAAAAIFVVTTWDPDGAGPLPAELVIGGHFAAAGNSIQRWDVNTQTWQPLGTGMNNDVNALTSWDPDGTGPILPQLIAGGAFTTAGGVLCNRIARWDGAAWQPLASGMNGAVLSLTTLDPDGSGPQPPVLVAGGAFTTAGGAAINRLAKFDGLTWTGFGTGANSTVWALGHWDPGTGDQMVLAGDFTAVNGVAASRIARWDGTAFQPLGAGLNSTVRGMTTWDPDGPGPMPTQLIACGAFTASGVTTINRIAAWDGTTWSGFGASVNGSTVYAAVPYDLDNAGPVYPQLIAGGDFTLAAGNTANSIAAWVSSPTPVVITSPAPAQGCPAGQRAFTVRAAAGAFPSYQWRRNGVPLNDGTSVTGSSILGSSSITLTISNMSGADAGAYDVVVTNACGSATSQAATLTYCPANCDCSTTPPVLNVNDFTCFLNRFAAGSTFANCDGSTTPPILNVLDFTCFLNTFAAGCP
jgi:hypothetical protein